MRRGGSKGGVSGKRSTLNDVPTRLWTVDRPVDLATTLSVHRRGTGDPTYRVTPDGAIWRTARTPEGPGTIRLLVGRAASRVAAEAWGPGADWLIDVFPQWLGSRDEHADFVPDHPVLKEIGRRRSGLRIGRTNLVMEALVPAILEQKVTGRESWRSWRELLRWYGEPAPGPVPQGMRVVPAADTWRHIPSWDWHRAGVGPERSRTIVRAARVADRLEEITAMSHAEAERRLRTVPGIGVWTAAEVRQRACGDPDAVSVGDFHLSRWVGWVLAGEDRADDARMLDLLHPFAGQRYRVCRLIELSGRRPPRRGPRFAPRDYRAM